MISAGAIDELKARNPCDQVAAQWVRLQRGGKLGKRGPCPLHSPDPEARDSTAFECNAESWVCAVCQDGGDAIRLVALRHGLDAKRDFVRVVELLGGAAEPDADCAAELQCERDIRKNKREQEANIYRERERRAAFDIWHRAARYPGTPVEDYLKLRGLTELPERLPLRFAPAVAFFHGTDENEIGRAAPRVIHRGPVMLAPIVDAGGRFRALHITWLDLATRNGKAEIYDPASSEALPAKKVRGSKAGNVIRLIDGAGGEASQLIMGEGIETALSVWLMLRREGCDLARTAFWAGVDLGNLGGKALKSMRHPALKDARGRARPVPGPVPDLEAPGIVLPASVSDVILLGDGDSDRFSTECALARASARFAASLIAATAP